MLDTLVSNLEAIHMEVYNKLKPSNLKDGLVLFGVAGELANYDEPYIVTEIIDNFSVTKPDSGTYTFALNSNGYYESNNKAKSSTYALCKVTFNVLRDGSVVTFDCISYGENNYDFGLFSNLDSTLTSTASADTDAYFSFKGKASSSVQKVVYNGVSAGEHFVYIKYRKDGSVDSNNDSLQFKLLTESRAYKNVFIYSSQSALTSDKTKPDGTWGTFLTDEGKLANIYEYRTSSSSWVLFQDTTQTAKVFTSNTEFINNKDFYGSDRIAVIYDENGRVPFDIVKYGQIIKIDEPDTTVVLDTAVTSEEEYHVYRHDNQESYIDNLDITLNSTSFRLEHVQDYGMSDEAITQTLEYTSTDGLTYTLTTNTFTNTISIWNEDTNPLVGTYDSRMGIFLYNVTPIFSGLKYKSNSSSTSSNNVSTQLTVNQYELPNDATVYASNNVISGLLYSEVNNNYSNLLGKFNVYGKLKEMLENPDIYVGKDIRLTGYKNETLPITTFGDVNQFVLDAPNLAGLDLTLGNVSGTLSIRCGASPYINLTFGTANVVQVAQCSSATTIKLTGTMTGGNIQLQGNESVTTYDLSEFTADNITNISFSNNRALTTENFPIFNTAGVTSLYSAFAGCSSMESIPEYDFSNVTGLGYTFQRCTSLVDATRVADIVGIASLEYTFEGCSSLTTLPVLDLSHLTSSYGLEYVFGNCPNLTEESLNNLLGSLASVPSSLSITKQLSRVGLSEEQCTVCATLSNYQALVDLGWTTGYETEE